MSNSLSLRMETSAVVYSQIYPNFVDGTTNRTYNIEIARTQVLTETK